MLVYLCQLFVALAVTAISGDPKQSANSLMSCLEKEISHEEETYEGTPEDIDTYLSETGWEVCSST
jgi:hypothetical protein